MRTFLIGSLLSLLAPASALAAECPAPERRATHSMEAGAQQDEILAAQLDAVAAECRADSPKCEATRRKCVEYTELVSAAAAQHDEAPFLSDIETGWLGQPYVAMSLPEPGAHGPAACMGSAADALNDAVSRRKAAGRHRRVIAEWEHWLRFAESTTERCKSGAFTPLVHKSEGSEAAAAGAAGVAGAQAGKAPRPGGAASDGAASGGAASGNAASGNAASGGAASGTAASGDDSSTETSTETGNAADASSPDGDEGTAAGIGAAAGAAAGGAAVKKLTEAERRAQEEKEKIARLQAERRANEERKKAALEAQRREEEIRRARDEQERRVREEKEAAERRRREEAEAAERKRREEVESAEERRQREVAEAREREEASKARAQEAREAAEEKRREEQEKRAKAERIAAEKKQREEQEAKKQAAKKEAARLEKQEELRRAEFEKKRRERELAEKQRVDAAAAKLEQLRLAEEQKLETLKNSLEADREKSQEYKDRVYSAAELESRQRIALLEKSQEQETRRAREAAELAFTEEDRLEAKRREQADDAINEAGRFIDPRARTPSTVFAGALFGVADLGSDDGARNLIGLGIGGSYVSWFAPPLEGLSSGFELLGRASYERRLSGTPAYGSFRASPHARFWLGRIGLGAAGEFRQQSEDATPSLADRSTQEFSLGPAVSFAAFDNREVRLIASARWLPLIDGEADSLAADVELSWSVLTVHLEAGTLRGRSSSTLSLEGVRASGTLGVRYRFD